MTKATPDWDPPNQEDVLNDQRAGYDKMRERCPVAYSEFMQWSLFRHKDITRVVHDHDTFSNAVSQHLSVPDEWIPRSTRPIAELSSRILLGNGWMPSNLSAGKSPRI